MQNVLGCIEKKLKKCYSREQRPGTRACMDIWRLALQRCRFDASLSAAGDLIARSGARIGEEMNYQEALAYMQECNTFGVVPGLENIKELLARLGNPQEKLSFIHIAGTNGKGSVMNFISTVLTEGGYKTGRYISPAIFEYRELFQINGKPISKAELGKTMEPVREAAEAMVAETGRHPTVLRWRQPLLSYGFVRKNVILWCWKPGWAGCWMPQM